MTKEFIVRKLVSSEVAIEAIKLEVAAYLLGLDNPEWEWLIKPEAMFARGGWRAYARIEWTKA